MRYEVRLMEKYAKGKKDGINELRRHYKQLVAALREGDRLDELPNALEDDLHAASRGPTLRKPSEAPLASSLKKTQPTPSSSPKVSSTVMTMRCVVGS